MRSTTVYFTIASANYLSKVETLKNSLEDHAPHAEFKVLLCESPEICASVGSKLGFDFHSPDMVTSHWKEMAFYYNQIEYNTALKPYFILSLLDDGYEKIFYIDPDIEFYHSTAELEKLANENNLVLTPHNCSPLPDDGCYPANADVVRAGQFNLGFIGLNNNEDVKLLVSWWASRLLNECIFDSSHRYFVDQFWADIFPSFIDKVHILRDPGYNVAYWNLPQRLLTKRNNVWMTNDRPLVFFHFSGLPSSDLTLISTHQDRIRTDVKSDVFHLLSAYRRKVDKAEWSSTTTIPYSFAKYDDGTPIKDGDRRAFLALMPEERSDFGNPFENSKKIKKIRVIEPSGISKIYRIVRLARKVKRIFSALARSIRTRGLTNTLHLVYNKSIRFVKSP